MLGFQWEEWLATSHLSLASSRCAAKERDRHEPMLIVQLGSIYGGNGVYIADYSFDPFLDFVRRFRYKMALGISGG